MLGLRAVGDVAGTQLAELGHDGVEVAERLPQEDERAEQHRLLLLQVGSGEERLHRRRRCEEASVEDVHQLVAAGSDEVEARLECFQIQVHDCSSRFRREELRLDPAYSVGRRPHGGGFPPR